MARVLVVGESWFTYSVHQKGFDAFYTSEYAEGADAFLGALRERGHEVTYVPSHQISQRLPTTVPGFADFDVVVISDVGANSFQLAPETFNRSVPSADKSELVRHRVEDGGGLLMIGGYLTFSGRSWPHWRNWDHGSALSSSFATWKISPKPIPPTCWGYPGARLRARLHEGWVGSGRSSSICTQL